MPSDFFERLVQDRRDGIAPPQVEQMKQAEPEPEPPASPEVTFSPGVVPGAWTCSRCFALVDGRLTPNHADWHRRIGG